MRHELVRLGNLIDWARLEEHFNIPTGRRDLPPRQQTVIATIRWSYDLLAKEERELLCDVAVFSGGFTLDAAEVVCVHDAIDRSSILPILSSLIDKSLVNVEHLREGVRYALLDSVRSFGLDRLREAGNETCAFRRHAQWLAAIADDIDRKYAQTPPEISEALLPEARLPGRWMPRRTMIARLQERLSRTLMAFGWLRGVVKSGGGGSNSRSNASTKRIIPLLLLTYCWTSSSAAPTTKRLRSQPSTEPFRCSTE